MSDEHKRIVEINGIKLEVDLRTAKRVDEFRVGDPCKILKKEYGDTHKVYPAMVVGFEDFKTLPTIVVAYLEAGYDAKVCFQYINAESKDIEITASADEYLPIDKADVCERMDRAIVKAEAEVEDLKRKKAYFLNCFGRYFRPVASEAKQEG